MPSACLSAPAVLPGTPPCTPCAHHVPGSACWAAVPVLWNTSMPASLCFCLDEHRIQLRLTALRRTCQQGRAAGGQAGQKAAVELRERDTGADLFGLGWGEAGDAAEVESTARSPAGFRCCSLTVQQGRSRMQLAFCCCCDSNATRVPCRSTAAQRPPACSIHTPSPGFPLTYTGTSSARLTVADSRRCSTASASSSAPAKSGAGSAARQRCRLASCMRQEYNSIRWNQVPRRRVGWCKAGCKAGCVARQQALPRAHLPLYMARHAARHKRRQEALLLGGRVRQEALCSGRGRRYAGSATTTRRQRQGQRSPAVPAPAQRQP